MALLLPCRDKKYYAGCNVNGHIITSLKSIDPEKTVFSLINNEELIVIHGKRRINHDLVVAMQRKQTGPVPAQHIGMIDGDQVVITSQTRALPSWNDLDIKKKKELILGMLWCIKSFHDLGFCHLSVTRDSFVTTNNQVIALTNLCSAEKYSSDRNKRSNKKEIDHFDAPETSASIFNTASDYYSLGVALKTMIGRNLNNESAEIRNLIEGLTKTDYVKRYNYQQAIQTLRNTSVERSTGPRTYIKGKMVGNKCAYSDRQLALYLSSDYAVASRYISRKGNGHANRYVGSISANVAALIKKLDPTLPLYWKGVPYRTTKAIAAEMNRSYPRMSKNILEMLKSGILLDFDQIKNGNTELNNALRLAIRDPQGHYWEVAKAIGARYVVSGGGTVHVHTSRTQIRELLIDALNYGNPRLVADVLRSCSPGTETMNDISAKLQSIPKRRDRTNLWKINLDDPFNDNITTTLPREGTFVENATLDMLFPNDRSYIIDPRDFDRWTQANSALRQSKRQRNWHLIRLLAWLGLGAGAICIIIALLPYIIAGGLILLIIAVLIGL